jgi:hypothetical protein
MAEEAAVLRHHGDFSTYCTPLHPKDAVDKMGIVGEEGSEIS